MFRVLRYCVVVFGVLCCVCSAYGQSDVVYKIEEGYDRMFYNTNNPKIEVKVRNKEKYLGYASDICCKVETYDGTPVYEFFQKYYIAPADSTVLGFSFKVNPGFYRIILEKNGEVIEKAVMGYEPELLGKGRNNPLVINGIEQFAKKGDSLDTFLAEEKWKNSFNLLKVVPMNATVEKVKKIKGKLRNIYKVTLKSAGNTVIEGYYAAPKENGVYPVVVTCTDKNENIWMPDGNSYGDRIDFVVSPRSEGAGKEKYYFDICMDVIRAVDFVVQRKEVDLKNIYLAGRGQGGALAIGAAALDDRVAAVAVYAPGLLTENVLGTIPAYDIKNLGERVKCPVLMGIGLEDDVCAPYESFGIYNTLKCAKEYYVFVDKHSEPALWRELADNFYSKHRE